MGKAIAKVYRALRDTRDGGHNRVSVGIPAEFIGCPRGIPCLHASKLHSRSNSCSGLGELVVDADGTSR